MSLFICIAIGVIAVVALLIGQAIKQSRKFKKVRSKIILDYKSRVNDWMENVRQANTDNDLIILRHQEPEANVSGCGLKYEFRSRMRKLVAPTERKVKAQPDYLDLVKKIEGAKRRQKRQRGLQLCKEIQARQNEVGKLVPLFELLALPAEELVDLGLSRAQIRFQIMQAYLGTLHLARQGDRSEFLELRAFFGASKEYHLRKPINGRPEDWAELVVRYLETPDMRDFTQARYNHQMPQPGELRLVAAEAIRTESLVQSQEVLAYCNYRGEYRQEVGDRLLAELAKLVDRLQIEAQAQEQKAAIYG